MGLSPTTVVANGSPRANLWCISQIDDTPETDGNINELAKFDCGKYYYYYYATQCKCKVKNGQLFELASNIQPTQLSKDPYNSTSVSG